MPQFDFVPFRTVERIVDLVDRTVFFPTPAVRREFLVTLLGLVNQGGQKCFEDDCDWFYGRMKLAARHKN